MSPASATVGIGRTHAVHRDGDGFDRQHLPQRDRGVDEQQHRQSSRLIPPDSPPAYRAGVATITGTAFGGIGNGDRDGAGPAPHRRQRGRSPLVRPRRPTAAHGAGAATRPTSSATAPRPTAPPRSRRTAASSSPCSAPATRTTAASRRRASRTAGATTSAANSVTAPCCIGRSRSRSPEASTFTSISAGAGPHLRPHRRRRRMVLGQQPQRPARQRADGEQLVSPVAVGGGITFATISAGFQNTCGVATRPAPRGAGATTREASSATARSISSATPVQVTSSPRSPRVSSGYQHACGVTTAGAAFCWGSNDQGQLGTGDTQATRSPSRSPAA